MCAVSVIYDYYRQRPDIDWTRSDFTEFQEIIRRLEALDGRLDQPDCVDPSKAEWMKGVEVRLAALEHKDG